MDTPKALASYIRSAIAAQRISGLTLAKRAGIAQSNVSRILSGETAPTTDILEKLAAGLGVSIADMFSGAPPPVAEVRSSEDVADAKRVARLATAFAKCDDRSQRIILELVETLAKSGAKEKA